MPSNKTKTSAKGRQHRDRGVGMPVVVAVFALLVVVAQAVVWAIGWIGCGQIARSLADNAALAAAASLESGADACEAARRVVQLNRGELESCRVVATQYGAGVSVQVSVPLVPKAPFGQQRVIGEALAGPAW